MLYPPYPSPLSKSPPWDRVSWCQGAVCINVCMAAVCIANYLNGLYRPHPATQVLLILLLGKCSVGKRHWTLCSCLDHEARDDSVYFGALVPEAWLPRAELPEVLRRPRHQRVEQFYLDPAQLLAISSQLQVHFASFLFAWKYFEDVLAFVLPNRFLTNRRNFPLFWWISGLPKIEICVSWVCAIWGWQRLWLDIDSRDTDLPRTANVVSNLSPLFLSFLYTAAHTCS